MALCAYDFHEVTELAFQLCLPLSSKTVDSVILCTLTCSLRRSDFYLIVLQHQCIFVVAMTTVLLDQT